ncbi:MAG: FAD-dependent oxidoreductase, partial [Pirellula sp.]
VDVVVFGATPAGVAAALGAASDGCNVLLVEPTHRIGGLLTSGLSHSDFHSRESLSGAFWSFAKRVTSHYQNTYGPNSQQAKDCSGGVFAEPKVNLLVLEQWLAEKPAIRVVRNCKLKSLTVDRIHSKATRIRSISFTMDGRDMQVECRVAIDASYEGDLMAQAGVSWRVGRESRKEYGESLAPEAADEQLQAYNFRFVMTKEPQNRVTPVAPKNYRREDFVGVLDALVAGKINKVFDYPRSCIFKAHTPPLPNGKYDINDVSQNIVRLSLPGKNLPWPNGNPSDRKAVFDEHVRDQVGLLYFLQNDESVPEKFRSEAKEWGWCRDEFVETEHLPPQLYVREARRMVGLHVYTQHDAAHAPKDARAVFFAESIAMGDYGNNCHGTAHEGPRFGGKHTGEFYNPVPPYQIPHGVMVPREVNNLLVPVAASSTHVGFCALRLEPIWMSLGQAAGHAAAQSIQHNTSVQQTAIKALQHRLHSVGAATIYVSDVLPDHPDFVAVQWWGAQGGLHGLAPMPNKPGQRGRNLHGQYYEANPEHTANLDVPLDDPTLRRWKAIAILSGLNEDQLPSSNQSMTRGDFVRSIYQSADRMGLVSSRATVPRLHREGLPNQHAPGEVDILELVHRVVPDPSTLPGIVVDDCDAVLEGKWQYSTHTPPYVGRGYLHDMKEDKGAKSATYIPDLPRTGIYEVRVSHCYNIRRATNTQIVIRHADGETSLNINQQVKPEHAELFRSLGRYRFVAGTSGWVRVVNAGDSGKVAIADAVQFLPAY